MASTIKDVAKMADVSISTVSRVINDSKPVSPEAKRRVLHAIEVLDYRPNEVARSLVTKKSNIIGVIVDDIGSAYASKVLRGVEEVGRMYNYDILLSSSYGDPEIELKFAKLFAQKQVEGIILISAVLNQKLMYKLEESRIPYININRFYDIEENLTVRIDYEKASYDMTKYLIEQGHENIAAVVIQKDIDRTEEKYKLNGYKKAMKEEKLQDNIVYTMGIKENDIEEIFEKIDETINSGITALFCSQDEIAIHIINHLVDKGLKVPQDVSVTGFGGTDLMDIYRPRLTTAKISYYDIGAVAIRRILKRIENKEVIDEERISLPVQILKRDSVKSLKK
ncbi:LacI family DNA-binding transcriptional regulator [Peptoniphilus sp. oral taxon 386]|uniref:LacI family DNA-binding transcriptional regulator n=1 Tax=Peptoniphilus sp. oral taxon 386 TaxID=652713 RepID=UPI0001DAA149|nr:LacI family DNA-binding transcriptional regulator [Peptoniphilus sp. oral taxon 386]EFI41383.1 putative catabolite control protein A [Peptoniphilus sp. oral taxon 386 str. F0131]